MRSEDNQSGSYLEGRTALEPATGLPARLRLLCVSPEEPSWASLTLNLDAAGCHEPQFHWCSSAAEALALLRRESFDCVVLGGESAESGLGLVQGMRAAGCDDPAVLIAATLDDPDWVEFCRLDCEVLPAAGRWESAALAPFIERAIRRAEQVRENHRLAVAQHRRVTRERDEAEKLLTQQRQIIRELAAAGGAAVNEPPPPRCAADHDGVVERALSPAVRDYYHELLRTYVIMGSGNLGGEIARLAELVCTAGLGPRDVLELHLERVETLVRGLGNRSTRHIMARADLLALELMTHVGEFYRSRSR